MHHPQKEHSGAMSWDHANIVLNFTSLTLLQKERYFRGAVSNREEEREGKKKGHEPASDPSDSKASSPDLTARSGRPPSSSLARVGCCSYI
jgi:hypothetical protein